MKPTLQESMIILASALGGAVLPLAAFAADAFLLPAVALMAGSFLASRAISGAN